MPFLLVSEWRNDYTGREVVGQGIEKTQVAVELGDLAVKKVALFRFEASALALQILVLETLGVSLKVGDLVFEFHERITKTTPRLEPEQAQHLVVVDAKNFVVQGRRRFGILYRHHIQEPL